MKRRILLATMGAAAGLALAGAAPAEELDHVKACFVYVGPITDGGFTQAHHAAVTKMQEHFGDRVEVQYQESVAEGADAERVMTQMALGGCNIIFATSFGFGDALNAAAAKFPEVKFEHATGFRHDTPNISLYNARFYEGRAVEGLIAGRMTRSNKIGYIGTYPIPEVIMGLNSFYLNAKRVNPDVELTTLWIFDWVNPAKEADAAKAMIDQGVDVIAQHTDSTAPLAEMAKTDGRVIGFGQASDMAEYAPTPRVTSIIDDWSPYYIRRVQAIFDGTWEESDVWEGIREGMVVVGDITGLPDDVTAEAEDLRDAIAEGSFHPFTGPINHQDGTPWLADGETPPDGDLLTMDFLVEGIAGSLPQ